MPSKYYRRYNKLIVVDAEMWMPGDEFSLLPLEECAPSKDLCTLCDGPISEHRIVKAGAGSAYPVQVCPEDWVLIHKGDTYLYRGMDFEDVFVKGTASR